MSIKVQLRRDTKANWTSVNPILSQGEMGFETDTSKFKIGDGSTVWVSLQYTEDADFYQYSISRTVASNNLTVSLLNYEGNTPTATKPVKIMIGGVVRTISSAVTLTINAGTNNCNAGSTELATKEIDYFAYLVWATGSTPTVQMGVCRIGYANLCSDGVFSATNEKAFFVGGSPLATDSCVNIGRFNAILSAGAGYTWSIPATSVIVNDSINETRWLSSNSNRVGFTASGSTVNYKLIGNQVSHIFDIGGTSNATNFSFTLPFSPTILGPDFPQGLTQDNGANKTSPGRCTVSGNTVTCYSDLAAGAWTSSGNKLIRGQFIAIIQ